MTGIWKRLSDMVADQGAAALVTVHEARGSAPREAGARLAVRLDGAFHGTIGGGRLEWEALSAARAALAAGRGPARFMTHALGPDLGQCCGGRVTLLIETFGGEDAGELAALAEAEAVGAFEIACTLGEHGRVARTPLPSPLRGGVGGGGGWAWSILQGNDDLLGDPDVIRDTVTLPHHPHPQPLPARGRGDTWREQSGATLTSLLLFGAGHVGRALVLALAPLPFRVRWFDARPNAFPAHIPPNAAPVHADDLAAAVAAAPPGSFVLIMTHDHGLDLAVTAAALSRPDLPFVGLIGSATKRARFEKRLRELGLPEPRITALACPIGVPGITGKEPAVIAAATAAQLLIVREGLSA